MATPRVWYGHWVLTPWFVVALAVLLVNDHALKRAAAGTAWAPVTGKLSDLAGLCAVPLLLAAVVEGIGRGRYVVTTRAVVAMCAAVGGAFIAVKLSADARDVAATVAAWARWPLDLAIGREHQTASVVTADATDVATVVALAGSWHAARRLEQRRAVTAPSTRVPAGGCLPGG